MTEYVIKDFESWSIVVDDDERVCGRYLDSNEFGFREMLEQLTCAISQCKEVGDVVTVNWLKTHIQESGIEWINETLGTTKNLKIIKSMTRTKMLFLSIIEQMQTLVDILVATNCFDVMY